MNRYGKKYKRVMAVVMALLLGGTSADFGTFPIHAASRGRETIVEFRNLPEKVRRQELEKGAEESAIVFPENLEVILEIGAEREGKAATRSSLGKKKASPSSAESRIVEDDEKEPDEVPLINDLKDIIQSKMRSEAWRPPFAPMTVYAAATPSTVTKDLSSAAAGKTASEQAASEGGVSDPIQREAVLENISWELDEDRSSRHQFSSEKPGDVFVYIPVIPEKYAVDADAKLPAVTVRIVDKKTGYPGFEMSRTVGGVKVTVSADEGVFPEDAVLSVTQVPIRSAEEADAAVEKERDSGKTVAVSYTFDIRVLDKDGNELQPGEEGKVRVSFAMAETADRNLETDVYHIREDERSGDLTAEKLESEVDERTETVTAETDGFSLYTVEFTYNSLQYVMPGGTVVPLADVLDTVGLTGNVSAVEVSDSTLFSASNESGDWVITSHQPFSSTEWMKVALNGIVYEITVTDVNVNTWAGLQAAFTAGNDVTLTGNVTAAASDERLSIPAGVNITLDLNGHTINRNRTAQESNGHVISLSGTLTLKDSGTGGKITGGNNYSSEGGAIVVFSGGKLIMQGGTISGNEASQLNNAGGGGGVYVKSGGSFTMSGGSIEDNIAGFGGGVYVASDATFTMSGGSISNNRADRQTNVNSSGAGVYLAGSFTMSGGTISGNIAGTHGGGIDMGSGADFTMSGGNITGNTAGFSGGGICSMIGATTTIKGGSITNNTGGTIGGINARGTFNLQGNPTISGNKSGSYDSNLYAATTIHITGALTNSTPIGVTTATTPGLDGVYFTNGLQSPGNANYAKFKSDSEKYYMGEYTASSGKEATLYAKYEIYMNCTSMEYFTPTTPYYQYVVPGSAMTETVFTANTNYGFSTGYSGTTVNGITAERISQTQVRVSGTPTGNNQRIEIPLYRALHLYTVSITAGSNMTKTSGSGAASQTVASGDAITSVVYQAKSGYQFPTDYSSLGTTYGVTVTRDSASQITISGTPTATKNIALAEPTAIGATAPTITSQPVSLTLTYGYSSTPLTLSAGMISGHTLSYQWQSSTNGSSWSNISGATSQNYSIPTGYSVGIKYYRCRVTATRNDNSQTASTYSNSATVTISPRTAALSWSNTSLTYNRSSQKPTCKVSNLVSGDSCTVTVGGAQTNAGNNYTATATALSNSNYKLPTANTTSFTIAKKPVTLNWTNTSFTYDGNNHVPTATAAGVINGDTCNVTVTGEASSVGTHTATAESLSNSNYQLPTAKTRDFTIGTRTVTVSGITAENKVYDGGTAATLDYSGVTFDGIVSGDTLTVTATGTFGDKNAETGKTVSISGLTLGGASAGSYVLAGTGNQTQTTADITPKEVGLAWGETSFIYDGAEHLPEATATGLVDGDSCTVTVSGSATAPGTHTATAESLSNSNYQLPAEVTQSFTIGTRTVTVSGITAESRVYDGTTAATLDYSGVTFDGLVSGDTLTVTAAGTFSDKNAGTGKTVSIS
ncbi:MAG: hypothetical protein J6M58_05385, partial [Clostridium sp.]|nr:hypothetical protein [Clostridium sp.]